MKNIVLVGGGGHCKSCIDVIEQENVYKIAGILDVVAKINRKILGYKVVGTDEDIEKYTLMNYSFLVTVGQIKTSDIRKRLFSLLKENDADIVTIISPRAYVSKHAKVGVGSIIMHDALINADAIVGDNCIINSKVLIEHDAKIENHCHISTGAIVNGGATIKEGTFFGSNSVSKEYVSSMPNSFVKAGSLFTGEK